MLHSGGRAVAVFVALVMSASSFLVFFYVAPEEATAYSIHSPIVIHGNAEFTAANGVVSGSGAADDPYIIEGWEIDTTGLNLYSGIDIYGTSSYFVVRNVFVHGDKVSNGVSIHSVGNCTIEGVTATDTYYGILAGTGTDSYFVGNHLSGNIKGVYTVNSHDITIRSNTISACDYCGIWMDISRNMVVRENTISNNPNGVCVVAYDYGYSSNIRVYSNNLVGNSVQGHNWSTTVVEWNADYPTGGNYWSDYIGVDVKKGANQDQPGSDGIGDTPYFIDSYNQDSYPLMQPVSPVLPGEELGLIVMLNKTDSLFRITDPSITVMDGWIYDGVLKGRIQLDNRMREDVTVGIASSSWIRVHPTQFQIPSNSMNPENKTHLDFVMDVREGTPKDGNIWITSSVGWSKDIPIRLDDFVGIESTAFDISTNGYSFRNWNIVLNVANCYGMSVTSALYYEGKIALPANKPNAYSLTFDEAEEMIFWYQQSYYGLPGDWTQPNNFLDLDTLLTNNHPSCLVIKQEGHWFPNHAILAYTAIEREPGKYLIAVYDSNYPLDPRGEHNKESISLLQTYRWARYDEGTDGFSYDFDDGSHYTSFFAFEPKTNPIVDIPLAIGGLWNGLMAMISCPVNVTVTDASGRHLGWHNGTYCDEIPYANLTIENHTKFLFLPTNSSIEYDVIVRGEESGEYSLRVMGSNEVGEVHMINLTGVDTSESQTDGFFIYDSSDVSEFALSPLGTSKDYSLGITALTNQTCSSASILDVEMLGGSTHAYRVTSWESLGSSTDSSIQLTLDIDSDGIPEAVLDLIQGTNCHPVAFGAVDVEIGDLTTMFEFSSQLSWDLSDPSEALEVRWDFDADGTWDTDWSTDKVVHHQYNTPGNYMVRLEVRDTEGLTNSTTVQVEVWEVIPEFPPLVVPVLLLLFLVAVAARNGLGRSKPK